MPSKLHLTLAMLAVSACTTVSPRFSQSVAQSFSRSQMYKLTTLDAEVYYPREQREAAIKMLERMEQCLGELRRHPISTSRRGKALVFLTSANFNNAYVTGQSNGEPLHTLDPLYTTTELLNWYGLASTSTADIGCHELLHFVHFEQVDGLWWFMNTVLGEVYPPQTGLERWFTEGLAQYYEGRLGRAVGRPHSSFYRGLFESGLASRVDRAVSAGDLNGLQRELLPASGAYLTSLPFIEYLAQTYGEQKLWEVIDFEGHSLAPPLGVALVFKSIYGLSLGALVDEWSAHLQRTLPDRQRPAEQRVLRANLGSFARLASAPDGTLALLTSGLDEVPMLRLLEPGGAVRAEVRLIHLGIGRDWVSAGPEQMTGLSFTADSRWLYVLDDDVAPEGDDLGQLWKVDATTGKTVRVWHDLRGAAGGAISPDGARYLLVRNSPGRSQLVELELASGRQTVVMDSSLAFAAPAFSPDGHRLVYSQWSGEQFELKLKEPGGQVRTLSQGGGLNYGGRFVDEDHVLFAREASGRLQVHLVDVGEGATAVLTDAPWTVMDPAAAGDDVAFLNRDGWGWSLDVAPRSSLALVEPSPADPPAPSFAPRLPTVLSDERYSSLEGLFVPLLRVPAIVILPTRNDDGSLSVTQYYQLGLSGRDRLGFHSWAIDLSLSLPGAENSQSLAYGNQLLAPWSAYLSGARDQAGGATLWSGSLGLGRTVYSTPIFGGFTVRDRVDGEGATRYLGPTLAFSHFSGDGTPYAGTRRALAASASVSGYPKFLGSSINLLDVSVGLFGAVPLPLSSRHTLALSLNGRLLVGAPEGSLQVGGLGRGTTLLRANAGTPEPGPEAYLPAAYTLGVRGYEDYSVRANLAAAGEARYRYPFIVDRGTASTFYLLPSFFFRQVDLEVFGAAAFSDSATHPWLRAAGAQLALRTAFAGSLAISLWYQFSWRFDAGLKPLHTVALSFE